MRPDRRTRTHASPLHERPAPVHVLRFPVRKLVGEAGVLQLLDLLLHLFELTVDCLQSHGIDIDGQHGLISATG